MNREIVSDRCGKIIFGCMLALVIIMPWEHHGTGIINVALFLPLICWGVKMGAERRVIFRKTPLDILILVYFATCVISTIFSIDPEASLRLLRKDIISYIILFYIIVNHITTRGRVRWLIYAFLLSGLVVCVEGTLNYFIQYNEEAISDTRLCGTFRQPNRYAQYLLILSSLLVAMIATVRKRNIKALLGVFLVLAVLNLFWTFSRAGWIGFAAMSLVYLFQGSKKMKLVAMAGIAILLIGVFATPKGRHRFLMNLEGDERLQIYKSAIAMFRDYRITGVGYGDKNFLELYRTEYRLPGAVFDHSGTHNIFLQSAVETGIIGLIAFVLLHLNILVVNLRSCAQYRDSETRWLFLWGISSFVAVFAIGQLHTLYRDRNVHIFWMVVALMIALKNIELKTQAPTAS